MTSTAEEIRALMRQAARTGDCEGCGKRRELSTSGHCDDCVEGFYVSRAAQESEPSKPLPCQWCNAPRVNGTSYCAEHIAEARLKVIREMQAEQDDDETRYL